MLATDLPAVQSAAIVALVDGRADHDAAVARTDRLEPLCAVWRPSACGPVLGAAFERGERAVRRAIGSLDVTEVRVAERCCGT